MRKSALTLACCFSASIQAAPVTDLNPVVVTASRSEHSLAQAPASVTVITAEQIKASGASNLLQAVRNVPGVTLNGRQVGGRKTLSIRGANDHHTLVLVDGKRISSTDDSIGHSDYQYGWVSIDQIERIEIVRGPMSALYGSEAMGGVINIITRKATSEWHGTLSARGDIQKGDGGNGHLLSAHAQGGLGSMFDLSLGMEQLRRSPTPGKEDKRISDIEGRNRENGNLRLGFTPLEGQRLQLELIQSDETLKRHQSGRTTGIYLDTYNLERRQHSLGWQADWSAFTSEVRYSKATFDVTNKRSNSVAPTRPQRLEDEVWDGSLAFSLGERHALTLGAEYRDEYMENAGLLPGGSDEVTHKAVFIQDEISLHEKWAMVLGFRLDRHGMFGNETSPRAYLVYQATPELTLKGGYGEGFRAPTLKQVSPNYEGHEGPHSFYGNPDIKPETSQSWELSADWRNATSAYTATIFSNKIKDMIIADRKRTIGNRGHYVYDNVNRARIHGLELSMSHELGAGFRLASNLTWLDTEDRDTGKHLTGRPELVFTPSLQWRGERMSAQFEWQYTGRQWLSNGTKQERVSGYGLASLSGNYEINDSIQLSSGVNNLGNQRLSDRSDLFGYVEEPRTLWVGVEARF